jgi:hypothetical protein
MTLVDLLEQLTFVLAMAGYAGLAATAVTAALHRLPIPFWRVVAAIIVAHVALVWAVRYEGSFAAATRNGYAGFLVFHAALGMIVLSVLAAERRARVLIFFAFAIVSAGALGAVFRYDVVAIYRVPVVLTAALGAAGLARAYWLKRRRLPAA